MKLFLWTMLWLYSLAVVGNIWRLVDGIKPRSRKEVAVDLVIYVVLVAWISVLIFG